MYFRFVDVTYNGPYGGVQASCSTVHRLTPPLRNIGNCPRQLQAPRLDEPSCTRADDVMQHCRVELDKGAVVKLKDL